MSRNKKGFTLLEVSVSLVIFLLVTAFSATVIIFAGGLYSRSYEKSQAAASCQRVCALVYEKLSRAISFGENYSGESYKERLIFEPDRILIERENQQPQEVITLERLNDDCRLAVNLTASEIRPELIDITVSIYEGEQLCYTVSDTVRLLNFGDGGGFSLDEYEQNGALTLYY